MIKIRSATDYDKNDIQKVYEQAFGEEDAQPINRLALNLLTGPACSENQSLVAEVDGLIIGHVAFSPVSIEGQLQCKASILAPLAVSPHFQKQGAGTLLVETGIRQLVDKGVNVVMVYGDPAYYGRFGFNADTGQRFTPPYTLAYPFGWQALIFQDCGLADIAMPIHCVSALSKAELW